MLLSLLAQSSLKASLVYGPGSFILNDGDVYSNTGNYIGSSSGSYNYSSGSVTATNTVINPGWLGFQGTWSNQPHTLTVSGVNGTVTKSPDLAIYEYNTTVTLTAVSDPGYAFIRWTQGPAHLTYTSTGVGPNGVSTVAHDYWTVGGNVVGTSPTLTVTTWADFDLRAEFAPISRIISLDGNGLVWDQQVIGESSQKIFNIKNTGNSPLTITDIVYPAGFSGAWSGSIAPGASQTVTVTFAPTAAGTYSGDIEIHSDATSGNNTLAITAIGEVAYKLTGNSSFRGLWGFTSLVQYTAPTECLYWTGSVVNVQALPVTGYVFHDWTENGHVVSTSPTFALTIQAAHTIRANYVHAYSGIRLTGSRSFGNRKLRSVSGHSLTLSNSGNTPIQSTGLRIANQRGATRQIFQGDWSGLLQPGESHRIVIRFQPSRRIGYFYRITPLTPDTAASVDGLSITGSGI
ncbi:MAG: choice-of-anchor D domain-containing protein [Chthoniobacterales bacterium]